LTEYAGQRVHSTRMRIIMETRMDYGQEGNNGLLSEILVVLFKHKVILSLVFLLVVGTVTVVALRLAPVYLAKTTFLIKNEREYLLRPEVGVNAPNSTGPEMAINAATQILTSRELAEQVINRVGINNLYPDIIPDKRNSMQPMDVAVLRLEKRLVVEAVNRSNVIKVEFEHGDPVMAANVLNLMVEFYKDKHLKVFSEPHSVYLEQQLNEYAGKLRTSDAQLESYRSSNRIYALDEQRSNLSKQHFELDTSLKNCRNSITELQSRVNILQSQQNQAIRENVVSHAPLTLKQETISSPSRMQLAGAYLRDQEISAQNRPGEENPFYLDLHRSLLAAEVDLKSQRLKALNLIAQINSVDYQIKSLTYHEQRLTYLTREKIVNEKNYQSYRERVDESRRLDEMNKLKLGNISILQPATAPVEPSKPNRLKLILSGIFGGLVAGVASAFWVEYRIKTLSTARQVERLLGVPVLISLPLQRTR
jgi:polysaccharide biosynthesis protein PslE